MTDPKGKRWWRLFRAPRLSPQGLVTRAALIAGTYLVAHFFGLRAYVGILTGTSGVPGTGRMAGAMWAALYVILYLGLVFVVPVLLIGAALMFVVLLVRRGSEVSPIR